MIYVVGLITAKPGKRAAFLRAYEDIVAAVRAEPGCLAYGPCLDAPGSPAPLDGDTFAVIGQWESMEHLSAHVAGPPHMVVFWEQTKDLVASRTLRFLRDAFAQVPDNAAVPSGPLTR